MITYGHSQATAPYASVCLLLVSSAVHVCSNIRVQVQMVVENLDYANQLYPVLKTMIILV